MEELPEAVDPPYDSLAIHTAFEREVAAFEKLKPALLQRYQGRVVAIYQGQVVAVGDDRMDVYGVVLKKFGQVPCYIEHVDEHSPRLKRMPMIRIVR